MTIGRGIREWNKLKKVEYYLANSILLMAL